jgi:hypothetical protein
MFYIQASTAASNNPEFIIKKVSGSDDEGKKLSVFGEYITQGRHQDTVHIDGTETIYTNEISYIESLNGVYHSPEIKQLQRDYRNFMRGKEVNPTLFYEDEAHLAYVNIEWDYHEMDHRPSNFSFDITVLDKDSNDVIDINEPIPEQNDYNHAFVEDVQKIDGKLKAAVRISSVVNSGEQVEEIHIYTFDLNSQTLIGDDILVSSGKRQKDGNSTTWNQLNVLNDLENIESQKDLLIQKVKVKEVPYRDVFTTEEIDRKFTIYNYETNEQKELSNDREAFNFKTASIYGSTIYFMNMSKNGLEIHPYGIESEEFSTKQTIQINIPKESGSPLIKLKNNKMYITSPYKDLKTKATLLVVDLKTWKTLYEGTIETRNLNENQKDYTLNIYALEV